MCHNPRGLCFHVSCCSHHKMWNQLLSSSIRVCSLLGLWLIVVITASEMFYCRPQNKASNFRLVVFFCADEFFIITITSSPRSVSAVIILKTQRIFFLAFAVQTYLLPRLCARGLHGSVCTDFICVAEVSVFSPYSGPTVWTVLSVSTWTIYSQPWLFLPTACCQTPGSASSEIANWPTFALREVAVENPQYGLKDVVVYWISWRDLVPKRLIVCL